MSKSTLKVSANQTLENVILWAALELLAESKKAHNGLDNVLLREIKSLHQNTTKEDLPEHLKKALGSISHGAMGYINTNGYRLALIERN